jgi:hypothetical protein
MLFHLYLSMSSSCAPAMITHSGVMGITAIADTVVSHDYGVQLTHLLLAGNCLGVAGARALAARVRENTTLIRLWVEHNALGDDGCTASTFTSGGSRALYHLQCCRKSMHSHPTCVMSLFCTVSDAVATHPTLQRLALDGNFIGDAGCISGS